MANMINMLNLFNLFAQAHELIMLLAHWTHDTLQGRRKVLITAIPSVKKANKQMSEQDDCLAEPAYKRMTRPNR